MPVPDPRSLHSLLMGFPTESLGKSGIATRMETTAKGGATPEQYGKIQHEAQLNNDAILHIIYDARNEALRKQCIGEISRADFKRCFDNGVKVYGDRFDDLMQVFTLTSFPETYFHPDIASVLFTSRKLLELESAKERIQETGQAILQAIHKTNSLATILLISSSHLFHHVRSNKKYNKDTVEFTLLTFSYFGAKRSGVREQDWFFYWKVFGSLMDCFSRTAP